MISFSGQLFTKHIFQSTTPEAFKRLHRLKSWRNDDSSASSTTSSAFKLKFWSNDDSPVIRPAVLSPKWPKGYSAPVPPKTGNALSYGTGECERVTQVMARSNYTKLGNFLAITCLGTLVFSGLLILKGNDKKIQQTNDRWNGRADQ